MQGPWLGKGTTWSGRSASRWPCLLNRCPHRHSWSTMMRPSLQRNGFMGFSWVGEVSPRRRVQSPASGGAAKRASMGGAGRGRSDGGDAGELELLELLAEVGPRLFHP